MAKANQPTPQSARIPPDIPSDPGISSSLGAYLRNFALWCRDGFAEQMRNNQALPGVMLMGFNAPAGTNPAVYLLQVGNGGTLWLTPMKLGSGDLGTPVVAQTGQFKPLIGVTDGSNAPAGQVGEYLTAGLSNVSIPANAWTNTATLTLPPGDWDVSADVHFNSGTTAPNNIAGGISLVTNGLSGGAYFQFMGTMNASGNFGFPIRTSRFNVTTNTNLYLPVYANGGGTGTGALFARRAR